MVFKEVMQRAFFRKKSSFVNLKRRVKMSLGSKKYHTTAAQALARHHEDIYYYYYRMQESFSSAINKIEWLSFNNGCVN